ncbi:class II glutamine amidotransferase [Candidatus Nanopelagicales bacterium]|nr:class II glutamine amidotransferase [Candidatus Nanopelagicales bacterium]
MPTILFNSGSAPIHAEYWLVDAPDSMSVEGKRNPDGTGIGWFSADNDPHMDKQPMSAAKDAEFAHEARRVDTNLLVSHVRMTLLPHNRMAGLGQDHLAIDTHPFLIKDRLVAHNGGFGDLAKVEEYLGDYMQYVHGHTDSERYAALIAKETDSLSGDVAGGLAAAANWLSQNVPMYSLNCIVIADGQLWALRYPDQRSLHVATRILQPASGDETDGQTRASWEGKSALAHHRLTADQPAKTVLVASERIDDQSDWRLLASGELLHVDHDLQATSTIAVTQPPKFLHLPDEADPNDDSN